jgi:exonuclease SbcD
MSTLIIGDIHLGKSPSLGKPGVGSGLNSRIQDQMTLLNWCLNVGVNKDVDTFILTGDICEDPKPDYILLELFIDWLKRCEDSGIEVHIIAGNHDIKRTGSQYKSFLDLITTADLPAVYVYKYVNTFIKNDVGFTLYPFRDRSALNARTEAEALYKISSSLSYELASIPDTSEKVLIGHLAIKGSLFVGDEFDNLANELMCPPDLFQGYDYVWMGHVHKPQVRRSSPHIAHIGSLDISDFGETDHQKIVVLFDPKLPKKYEEIPVPSRPLRRIRVDVPIGFDSTDYVIDQINAQHQLKDYKNAIVKVEVKHLDSESQGLNRSKLKDHIYSLGAFHICHLSESKKVTVISADDQHDIDNQIDKKAAVKIWADNYWSDLDDMDELIDLANEFIDEFNSNES